MRKKRKHANIPVFIPHLGCPNLCVFCNQRLISGKGCFELSLVRAEIETALATICHETETEIAFFGGSFTGIDRSLMISLLDLAQEYTDTGRVRSIRLSTRPDYIDREILEILARYTVGTIELGIQSMDEKVLAMAKRGHTAEQSAAACRLIREYGFALVGQMMIGLPGSSSDAEVATAEEICRLGAKGARVYPVVVFRGTELAGMLEAGEYTPLDIEAAVFRTKEVLAVFAKHRIPVIRTGLCASENLASEEALTGGANHAAIGELAMGELYYELIYRELAGMNIEHSCFTIMVPPGETSKAVGQKKRNKERLMSHFGIQNISFREDSTLEPYHIKVISDTRMRRGDNCI